VVVAVLALLSARPCIAKTKCDQIKNGMSIDDVNAIMGKPGIRHLNIGHNVASQKILAWQFDDNSSARVVISGPNIFAIDDDSPTVVCDKYWIDETFSERIRRWFHWPWH
jgi:hypothetical protein